jgi:hypothetical protein
VIAVVVLHAFDDKEKQPFRDEQRKELLQINSTNITLRE